ncbi:hypothetical protein C8R45DRAFT_1101353 [Mycena sanguinolenta]|nr:hypothetical protein C8R45DRAFT_1101353 [Mycena sanguinolenta]
MVRTSTVLDAHRLHAQRYVFTAVHLHYVIQFRLCVSAPASCFDLPTPLRFTLPVSFIRLKSSRVRRAGEYVPAPTPPALPRFVLVACLSSTRASHHSNIFLIRGIDLALPSRQVPQPNPNLRRRVPFFALVVVVSSPRSPSALSLKSSHCCASPATRSICASSLGVVGLHSEFPASVEHAGALHPHPSTFREFASYRLCG